MKTLCLGLVLTALLLAVPYASARADDGPEQRADVTFENTPLRDALAQLGATYRKNVVVAPDVEGTVSLRLQGVTWKEALGLLAGANDLYVTGRDGILTITNAPGRAQADARVRKVEGLREEARARTALAALERQRKQLAESARRVDAAFRQRRQAREDGVRVKARIQKLREEHARLRAEHEAPESDRSARPKLHGEVQRMRGHDVRDLGPGPHAGLKQAIAAIVKAGGSVQERRGFLVVQADPERHDLLARSLDGVRAQRRPPARLHAPRGGQVDVAHLRRRAEALQRAAQYAQAAGAHEEARRMRERAGDLERRSAAAQHATPQPEAPVGDRLDALRHEVRALRAEVRELTALMHKLLQPRAR